MINNLMEMCFPCKIVTRHTADKPWITDWFINLIRNRQRAHMSGDEIQARMLRYRVNRFAVRLKGNRNNKTFLQRLRCILWVITLHLIINYYKMWIYNRKTELEASTCQFPQTTSKLMSYGSRGVDASDTTMTWQHDIEKQR